MDKEADFDMVIQRHLTRAHKLRAIQQMIAEDPAIVPELLEILTAPEAPEGAAAPASPEGRRRFDARTQAEKVVAYFTGNGNTAATVRQIAEGTGLSRNTVNALLYNSAKKNLFKSIKVGPKRKLWRLKEDERDENSEMTLEELAELGMSESDLDSDGPAEPAAKPATGPRPKYEPGAE